MPLLSKKNILITIFILCSYFNISAVNLSLDQGFTIVNISAVLENQGTYGTVDILRYRIIEEVSGFGLSLYLLNQGLSSNENNQFNEDPSFLDLELNWEPLYKRTSVFGLGLFCRVGGYIPKQDNLDYRFGLRADFRLPGLLVDLMYHPLVTAETGYSIDSGFYVELKTDLFIDLFILVGETFN